ncbi:MAG: hypothetical protein J1E34_05765 [Oscillospiraceae bacterium]|nr:hypothetical protein [Oscillospiraceae bacterium]
MSKEDTEGILQECDAGVKTAINSIDEVIDRTNNSELKNALKKSRTEHVELGNEIATLLDENGFEGKDPSVMSKLMSKGKINSELLIDPTDSVIAELMIDGCNMGIKKLSEYVNKFPSSSSPAIKTAQRVIKTEQELMDEMRVFL